MSSRRAVSLVLPAYNEGARIERSLCRLKHLLGPLDAELIMVDDGSRDDTVEIAKRVLDSKADATIVQLPKNMGKGAAVRAGVRVARGEAIVYMDADLASDLNDLSVLLKALRDAEVAIGSRAIAGSTTIGGTQGRAVMARTFNAMVRPIVRLPIRDTQCGFKAFRADAAHTIFGFSRSNRFAFDVELLAIASALEMRIVEIPVQWTAVAGSTVRFPRDPLQMMLDLPRIARRRRHATMSNIAWQPTAVWAGAWEAVSVQTPEADHP